MSHKKDTPRIIDTRHPNFLVTGLEWEKLRLTYRGGQDFRDRYLKKFTKREEKLDFEARRDITPIPAFAKATLNEIRNSIFQRMWDVSRLGGSERYQQAINGIEGGVDNRGNTMTSFLGTQVLEELLVMGRVGIYVDNDNVTGGTLASTENNSPYVYRYQLEDILNWRQSDPRKPSEFQSVLLRDTQTQYDPLNMLPVAEFKRFRQLWIDEGGKVNLQFFNEENQKVNRDGEPAGPQILDIDRIPFVMLDIGQSLLKDVADYQIALLNLGSSDIAYCLHANFPFYVEQGDPRAGSNHLKSGVDEDGTASTGGQGAADEQVRVGTVHGRRYAEGTERPGFIHPSGEPLEMSMKKQEVLQQDIRKLVNLAISTLATRASAESKSMDNAGLESGLSFIGLVLEAGERLIADYWAQYESGEKPALIQYPQRWNLETDESRIKKADDLLELMAKIPGHTAKRELNKSIITILLSGKVPLDRIAEIHKEIDDAAYTTSDPKTILDAQKAGLVGDKTASVALGFDDDEHIQADKDHTERIARIKEAQSSDDNLAARGVADLDENTGSGSEEREEQRDKTLDENTSDTVRGKAK